MPKSKRCIARRRAPRPGAAELLRSVVNAALISLCLTAVLLPSQAFAEDTDPEEGYQSVVVQNRKFTVDHELTIGVGVLPLDAFKKGVTVGGGYTFHVNELYAWEVVNFQYSFGFETELNDDLAAFDLKPTPFEVVKYYVSTNFVFKPVYWKGSVMNDSLLYGELMIILGGGYGWFTQSSRPMAEYGVAMRFFLSDIFSLRVDGRHLMFISVDPDQGADVHHELWINLGVSISL